MSAAVSDKVGLTESQRRSRANLRPFKPGQSGNPKGPPRRKTFEEVAKKFLGEPMPGESQLSRMQALVLMLFGRSMKGDMKACKLLLERTDPPTVRVDKRDLRVLQISIQRQDDAALDAGTLLSAAASRHLPAPSECATVSEVIDTEAVGDEPVIENDVQDECEK